MEIDDVECSNCCRRTHVVTRSLAFDEAGELNVPLCETCFRAFSEEEWIEVSEPPDGVRSSGERGSP